MSAFAAAFGEEIRRILRTPIDLAMLTLMPLVLLGAMAAMIWHGTPSELPAVVVDHDGGPLANAIVRNVDATHAIEVVARTTDFERAMAMVRREEAVAILVIPQGVGTRVAGDAPVEVLYQASFLSTGALASTGIRTAVEMTLANQSLAMANAAGLAALHPPLPGVQVTILGNPTVSLEWYLGLLLGPGILHLLIAVTCIASLAPLLRDKSFAGFARSADRPLIALTGRLAPHVLAGTLWGICWLLWLTLARGYRADGSLLIVIGGMALLFVATAAIALLLMAATREVSTALSGAVILAGSALAYSGASLPITGAGRFARIWSAILPLTHYLTLQMDQVLGANGWIALRTAGVLLLYPLIAGGLGFALIVLSGRRAA